MSKVLSNSKAQGTLPTGGLDGNYLRKSGSTNYVTVWSSVTLPNSATTGDILSVSASNVYSNIAAVASGSLLSSAGTGTLAVWSASPTLTTSLTVPLLQGGTGTTSTLTYKTTTGAGTGASAHIFQIGNNGAIEGLRIAPSSVGVAASLGIGGLNTTPVYGIDINTNDANQANIGNKLYSNSNTPSWLTFRSRGTFASPTAVTTNDGLGFFSFLGNTNTSGTFKYGASIEVYADGSPVSSTVVPARMLFSTSNSTTQLIEAMRIDSSQRVGIGVTPTAILHLKAGTATASTAPLKFITGTLLTTAEAGAMEFLTDLYYVTTTTGAKRRVLVAGTTGRSTGQTAAVASVATYTLGGSDASYEVSANVLVTTSSAEAFTVTCAYTDESNTARTQTMPFVLLAGTTAAAINFGQGAVPYEGIPIHLRCKASTTITIATTGTFTGATYNVEGIIKQTA